VTRAHLIDGTYELFRTYYGAPGAEVDGREVGAARALARSLAMLLRSDDVTHVGIAFDHVIESWRNDLWHGYKTGDGIEPPLMAQFGLAEEVAAALGIVVWPMVEFEADDALATSAARLAEDPRVTQVVIASPDKDLTQCVRGDRVVTWDRLRSKILDEPAVVEKFGVGPASIPDWLALVGDTADGLPGVPKWGARSAATVLARWRHLEAIPDDPATWELKVRGADALAASLREHREPAKLWKRLATLSLDAPATQDLDALEWRGADREALAAIAATVGDPSLLERVTRYR
jgi:5'-3' exonuclease